MPTHLFPTKRNLATDLCGGFFLLLELSSMLTINTRYERVAPTGDRSVISINDEAQLNYHHDLVAKGFQYKELRVSAPVDSACLACE